MLSLALVLISGTLTRVDLTGYTGSGLVPAPGAGQLDSDDWAVTGMNDGDTFFGGTFVGGDFGEGHSPGGVSGDGTGGLWSFDVAPGDAAFGIQQSGSDLTPGVVSLRFSNLTGAAIDSPTVRFEVWVWNDSTRASAIELDGYPQTRVVSGEAAEATVAWRVTPEEVVLEGVVVPAGGTLVLRWNVDAVSGDGGYDELAIDDVEVEIAGEDPPPPPPPPEDTPDPDAGSGTGTGTGTGTGEDGDGYVANGCDAGGGSAGIAVGLLSLGLAWRIRASRTSRRPRA
jgi:hypothetical protein